MGEVKDVYMVLVGKRGGKTSMRRTRRKWEDNFKMDLREVECGGMDWTELAQGSERWWTLVNAAMNLRIP
jgi:hypothetical protein